MKSHAHLKSHPLHPILVSFPIAFFIGTLVFDVLALANKSEDLMSTARWMNIAGCCMAVVAAVPGLIDFLKAVPPQSSAKKRAATHGSINVAVLILFLIAYRSRSESMDYIGVIVPEGLGVALLMIAGWMGGTLVYRNQIGVDIRYANAGKWKALDLDDKNCISLDDVKDMKEDQMVLIRNGIKRYVLTKTSNTFHAFEDKCTHRGGSLAGGSMICGTVQCPWHGSQFNVTNGVVKAGPATQPIKTFPVHVLDDRLRIDIK